MDSDASDIPDHESPLRRMMSDADGTPFHPLRSFDEARAFEDGVAILQGDWGGQIYAVMPVAMIQCGPETLHRLLVDLDTRAWPGNEPEGASIHYERKTEGSGVAGGMGGGAVTGDLWVHAEFDDIARRIRQVVVGEREFLESPDD